MWSAKCDFAAFDTQSHLLSHENKLKKFKKLLYKESVLITGKMPKVLYFNWYILKSNPNEA